MKAKEKDIIKSIGEIPDLSKEIPEKLKKRFAKCRENINKAVERQKNTKRFYTKN